MPLARRQPQHDFAVAMTASSLIGEGEAANGISWQLSLVNTLV